MTTSESSILCPVCDAPNGPRSVFCAECGSSLSDPTGNTGSLPVPAAPAERDSQSTSVISSASSWSNGDSQAKPSSAESHSRVPSEPYLAPADDAFVGANPYLALPVIPTESRRGFWLGLVAGVLMLMVLTLWIWASMLSESSRNSISDLFGFLS